MSEPNNSADDSKTEKNAAGEQIQVTKEITTELAPASEEGETVEDEEEEEDDGLEDALQDASGYGKPCQGLSGSFFLRQNTQSFKCLAQVLVSSSSLLKVILNYFPPLNDPGIDEAFNYVEPEDAVDDIGAEKYKKTCKELEIVPISRIIRSLSTDTLDLTYYGLSLKQMRALCASLKINGHIKYLNLQDNWMSPEAALLISDIMRENNSIRVLNLQECRIGEEGAEKLSEGIATTQFLEELDLSFNSIGDQGLKNLQSSFIENNTIRKLNISHNNFTEESGETVGAILSGNKSIEHLDLSWNQFCTGPGNKKLFAGLKLNENLKWLSLAWNGICTRPATLPITKYLKRSTTLEFIDLSNNRLTQGPLRLVRAALFNNSSLLEAKMGNNIYTPDEAEFLGTVLTMSTKNILRSLDMENMCVTKEFIPVLQRIRRMNKNIVIGRILSNYEIKGPNINKLLFARCRYMAMKQKRKKKRKDFGHFVLQLPDKNITRQDFEMLIKKKKVKKIDQDLLKELLSRFPARRDKISCVAMKEAYMELYPETELPPPKPKKKKKKKKKNKKKEGEEQQQNQEQQPNQEQQQNLEQQQLQEQQEQQQQEQQQQEAQN